MDVTMTDGSSTTNAISSKSHVTDNLKEALVTVTEISVVPAENGETDSNADPVVLSDEEFDLDLVDLAEGDTDQINDLSVPAGDYGQLRLSTGEVALTFGDDSENTGMIASNQVKLNFTEPFTVSSADDRVGVTVDWNVENSLEGNLEGQLVITPVVNATVNVMSPGGEEG